MKKLFVCMTICALAMVACTSSSKNQKGEAWRKTLRKKDTSSVSLDNLSVPNDHYDRVPSYEEQLNGSSYIQSSVSQKKNTKPNREMTVQKTVVDSQGNVLSGSSKNGITDQEVLTDEAE